MKLKVCGITQLEQLQDLQEMGVDYAGMIFYPGSKRYAGEVLASQSAEISDLSIKKVGVFVNADFDSIMNVVETFGLHAVQLHGDETDEFCLELMDKVKVIKAIRVRDEKSVRDGVSLFDAACDYFLFDTQTGQYGGSGQSFDWQWLLQIPITKPFFLSGGIGPADLEKVKGFQHKQLHALDINSRFELKPGIKDLEKVRTFHQQLNQM